MKNDILCVDIEENKSTDEHFQKAIDNVSLKITMSNLLSPINSQEEVGNYITLFEEYILRN